MYHKQFECDHSHARNVSIQVIWKFVFTLTNGLETKSYNFLFEHKTLKLQAKCSRPYAYLDCIQINGGLCPFILNTYITSTLFFFTFTHQPIYPRRRNHPDPVNMKPLLHTLEKGQVSSCSTSGQQHMTAVRSSEMSAPSPVHIPEEGMVSNPAAETSSPDQ